MLELRNNFSAYDATYVALAELLGGGLLTGDGPLAGSVRTHVRITLVTEYTLPGSRTEKLENASSQVRCVVELPGIEPGWERRSGCSAERSVVELPGIEPGSLDPSIGLLRA